MQMRLIILTLLVLCVLAIPIGCGTAETEEYTLVRWPDGEKERYAIEIPRSKGADVVIPDVRAVQIANGFLLGKGYWRYLDGFYSGPGGSQNTNEFWFVLDKHKSFPKCYTTISTNEESWIAWCVSRNLPTNIIEIKEFITLRSSPTGGGLPRL